MTDPTRRTTRYESLRTSRRVLGRMGPIVRFGLWTLGVSVFLGQVRPMLSDAQFTWGERRVMGVVALITIGGFALGGWVAGRLLKATAELIDLLIDGADAAWRTADLIELSLVPTLGRVAAALERLDAIPASAARAIDGAAVRRAIAESRWDDAERLLAAARHGSDAGEHAALSAELDRARESAIDALRVELQAARAARDPFRVIEARDALTLHLRGERLSDLDRQVARWLLNLIQDSVRSGNANREVAELAARVADTFGDTGEAVSLRAALPNLRRSAGLCPRCGTPWNAKAKSCPRCLATGPRPDPLAPVGAPLPEEAP